MIKSSWVSYSRPVPNAKLRLFCFPYAGGAAMIFRRWVDRMASSVEVCPVQLPGRGNRIREVPFTQMTPLVESVAEGLSPFLEKPFAFFGHSLGAIVSFELALKLQREGRKLPVHLFVSGRRAPCIPRQDPITYNLPDEQFVEELKRLNGTPKEVLEHAELMQLMLPVLKADFEISETYKHSGEPLLRGCPITAFGGTQDEEAPPEYLEAWQQHTTGPFKQRMLPGDHFFLHASEQLLLAALNQELCSMTARLEASY
jgi:medium-chain acyl-[acyl-carrier-protein] hydrolase